MKSRTSLIPLLSAVATGLVVIRVLLAWWSPNIHYPDEIFQTAEQAHRLVFGYGIIPWEFHEGIRNWFYPGILAGIMRLAALFTDARSAYSGLIVATMAALSIMPFWLFANSFERARPAILMLLLPGSWFQLVYFSTKTLTEAFSAHLFLIGLFMLYPLRNTNRSTVVISGLLMGLAIGVRIHYLPAVLISCFVLSRQLSAGLRCYLLVSLTLGLFAIGLMDAWTWDYAFQSMVLNVKRNLVDGVASTWGESPWFHYITSGWGSWGPIAIPLVSIALVGSLRYPLLLSIALVVLVSHSMIGHKEARFVYLALVLLIVLASAGVVSVLEFLQDRFAAGKVVWPIAAASWMAISMIGGLTTPAWQNRQDGLRALHALSEDTGVCGLATNIPWQETGGYYALHRPVPFDTFPYDEIDRAGSNYNRLLLDFKLAPDVTTRPKNISGYRQEKCFGTVCIFRTDLSCAD